MADCVRVWISKLFRFMLCMLCVLGYIIKPILILIDQCTTDWLGWLLFRQLRTSDFYIPFASEMIAFLMFSATAPDRNFSDVINVIIFMPLLRIMIININSWH